MTLAVIIAGRIALKTFYLQALIQLTAQKGSSNASDRDSWYMRMLSALDAFPLTCSKCVPKCFRDL